MSRFFSDKYRDLTPYTPGEQPQMTGYVKLNTNESPFSPSPYAIKAAYSEMKRLELYPDPQCRGLIRALANSCQLNEEEITVTNGSDEALYFAFLSFCDADHPAVFADITYGFYRVFAQLTNIPFREIPLKPDFSQGNRDRHCRKSKQRRRGGRGVCRLRCPELYKPDPEV